MAEAAGISRQVLNKWEAADPKTITLVYRLFSELDRMESKAEPLLYGQDISCRKMYPDAFGLIRKLIRSEAGNVHYRGYRQGERLASTAGAGIQRP